MLLPALLAGIPFEAATADPGVETDPHPIAAGPMAALRRRALDPQATAQRRFRAIRAWSRRLWAATGPITKAEVSFLRRALHAKDRWVRAQAGYAIARIDPHRLPSPRRAALVTALDKVFAGEADLAARAYEALALDRLTGSARAREVRVHFERVTLPHAATEGSFTLRSGLGPEAVKRWLARANAVADSLLSILGPAASTPVPGDPNPHWTVIIFASRFEYQAYMEAFVGFGAQAGGLYLERAATLYTFQREAKESRYTLAELLQHELTHALTGRFVFPGVWGDDEYHAAAKGWLDEGLAEVMAGLVPDGEDALPVRPTPLAEVCLHGPGPLGALLGRRSGYDEPGTFDYARAWAFVFYLLHDAPSVLDRIVAAFREDRYVLEHFERIAQISSLEALEDDWHQTVARWCRDARPPSSVRIAIEPSERSLRSDHPIAL